MGKISGVEILNQSEWSDFEIVQLPPTDWCEMIIG